MKRITILGASGHGKVIADIARLNGYEKIVFLDDNETIQSCGSYEVIGTTESIDSLDGDFIVGIGNSDVRKKLMDRLKLHNKNIVTLIHPQAVIGEDVTIGLGTVVMAGAVVNPETSIGEGVIINTCSSVDHDCVIDDYVHIAVGAHVCGTVNVGKKTWIGAGATVINNVSICMDCLIGAGSVVLKNIDVSGIYIGVPANRKDGKDLYE